MVICLPLINVMLSKTFLIETLLRRVEERGDKATNICAQISYDLILPVLKLTFPKMKLRNVSDKVLFLKREICLAPLKSKLTGKIRSKINTGRYIYCRLQPCTWAPHCLLETI